MDLETLNSLKAIDIQIEDLKEQLADLDGIYINGVDISSMGADTNKISSITENNVLRCLNLRDKLQKEINKKYTLRRKIYNFINTMDEEEAKALFSLKFVRYNSLRQIGIKMHMDHSTVKRKLDNYYVKYKLIS